MFFDFHIKKVSLLRFKSALFVNNQRKLHISTRIPTHTYIYITTHSTNIYINTRIYIYICVYIYIYIVFFIICPLLISLYNIAVLIIICRFESTLLLKYATE